MSRKSHFLTAAVLLLLAPLAGCNIPNPIYAHTTIHSGQRAPLGGPDGPAMQEIYSHSDFVRTTTGMIWAIDRENQWRGDEVADRVHSRLDRPQIQPLGLDEDEEQDQSPTYPNRPTIVCLDPLIVLIEPVQATARRSGLHSPIPFKLYQFWMLAPGGYRLPYGIESGRSIKTRENTSWIDLNVFDTPRPIVPDSDGLARLPVYWGHLELRPSGRGWKMRRVVDKDYAPPAPEPKPLKPGISPTAHTSTTKGRARPRRDETGLPSDAP